VSLAIATTSTPLRVASAQSQSPTRGTAAISGVVTDYASGRPIAGAVALLRAPAPAGGARQQVTDATGRFVFDELPASTQYSLEASKPGYVTGRYGELPGQLAVGRFALADDQWISTGNVRLTKVGAIGGVVTDEFGEPIVGALVRAIAQVTVGGRRQLAGGAVSTTDDRGEYRLAGLLPGKYLVVVPSIQHSVPASTTAAAIEGLRDDMYQRLEAAIARNPTTRRVNNGAIADGATRLIIGNFPTPPAPVDGRARAYPVTFHPGLLSVADAQTIDLSDGVDRQGINITLRPVPAVKVSGRVEGMSASARLTLRLVPVGLEGLAFGGEAATTILNADGTFTFLNVPSGAYVLDPRQALMEFRAEPIYIPAAPRLPRTPGRELLGGLFVGPIGDAAGAASYALHFSPGDSYVGRTPVTVGTADLPDLVVRVEPALTIRGRFQYEDLTRPPPQRANTVYAEPADGDWNRGAAASWNEGPGFDPAAFSIQGLAPGSYTLRPTPPAGAVVKSILVNGRDCLRSPFEIAAGLDLDIVVTFTGRIPALSGSVRLPDGSPAAYRTVLVFSTDRGAWPNLGLAPMLAKLVLTSEAGAFELKSLAAGDYYAIAFDAPRLGGWTDPAFLTKAAPLAARVSLQPGQTASVALTTATVK